MDTPRESALFSALSVLLSYVFCFCGTFSFIPISFFLRRQDEMYSSVPNRFYYKRENAKKAQLLRDAPPESTQVELAFQDITDLKNPYFVYHF